MKKPLDEKHDELSDKTKKYDEVILELIKLGHRDIIVQTLTDYLSSLE
jgi:hypothetical protein